MERRLVLFVLFSVGILLANSMLMRMWQGDPPPKPVAQQVDAPDKGAEPQDAALQPAGDEGAPAVEGAEAPPQAEIEDAPTDEQPADAPDAFPQQPLRRVMLGSLDPESPFKMGVTIVSRGAAVERIELNSSRYRDLEFDGGYLGHLALTRNDAGQGAVVGLVGPGTPAHRAGLQVGDAITAIGGEEIRSPADVAQVLERLRPGREVTIRLLRDGQSLELTANLSRKPLEVVQPENGDPLSLSLTLAQIDELKLEADKDDLPGEPMSRGNWELVSHDEGQATFRWLLPRRQLEVIKRFRLARIEDKPAPGNGPTLAYHLLFDVEVNNTGAEKRTVAYRLGGPTGLPTEGWWYANKISQTWFGGGGIRDVVVATLKNGHPLVEVVSGMQLARDKEISSWREVPLVYAGVDAQYFAAMVIPQKKTPDDVWFADVEPRRVGPVPADRNRIKLTDVSFRATTLPVELQSPQQGDASLAHTYLLFAGPKQPSVLSAYGLDGIIYFGWPIFGVVSQAMLAVLHFFHDYLHLNYALAIVMLTVLVRSALFPLSRKQALSAQKMQELAPEMKKLAEKYKNNLEARSKAQQELFRKHNYNPLAGCLPMFIQLPIFIGLYRSLSVDIELRQAPLISESVRWASNLSAPDQLFSWEAWMPAFVQSWLGPYFNLLPCITIALFIWQQKMFMPPPTDEQAALQYKMMRYMMIFMGVLFFRVPSGLCVYFIASSLWGIAERKLLPKTIAKPATGGAGGSGDGGTTITVTPRPAPASGGKNGSSTGGKKKQRGRK